MCSALYFHWSCLPKQFHGYNTFRLKLIKNNIFNYYCVR